MMIIVQTNDGSTTVELPDSGLTYHSKHGAIQESQHVFIDSGLHFYLSNNAKPLIHIFEMGFGTGLNCLLTYKAIQGLPVKIAYSTIELNPLPKSVYRSLNYCSTENLRSLAEVFEQMHAAEWNQPVQLSSSFQLLKIKGVGRWTVEMLLMFTLGREDVFAVDDLGIQQTMKRVYKMDDLPLKEMKDKMMKISLKWVPFRTYACLHLWSYKDTPQ